MTSLVLHSNTKRLISSLFPHAEEEEEEEEDLLKYPSKQKDFVWYVIHPTAPPNLVDIQLQMCH